MDPTLNTGLTLFETAIGTCGVAWNERGLVRIQLPEASADDARDRLSHAVPGASYTEPPSSVRSAIEAMTQHLRGSAADLAPTTLDMAGLSPFFRRVYEAARAIPSGTTRSYGELAVCAGFPRAARAVGQALGKNPFPIIVPCHRVVAMGNRPGGFSAYGGVDAKARLLAIEGVTLAQQPGEGQGTASTRHSGKALPFERTTAVDHLRARDPRLAVLIERVGPFRMILKDAPSTFAALAEAIVYQQLTGRAAATIFGRLRAVCPSFLPECVAVTPDASLRAAGLSRAKLAALKDLAQKTLDGTVPPIEAVERMDDEAIIERLTTVRGIGRWTVQMLLIFRLGRPDVLPVDDYGVRKGFARTYRKRNLPTRQQLAKHGERWRPFRTAASWYLWRALELAPA